VRVLFLLFLLSLNFAFSFPTETNKSLDRGWQIIQVFEDASASQSAELIATQLDQFAYLERLPSFGSTDSHIWLFIDQADVGSLTELWLDIDNPSIDRIRLYRVLNETLSSPSLLLETGDALPFNSRPVDTRSFVLPLDFSVSGSVLIELVSETPLLLPIDIDTPLQLLSQMNKKESFILFLFGVIFSMTVYNLVLYIGTRYHQYGWYCVYMLNMGMSLVFSSGVGNHYLWRDQIFFQNHVGYSFYILMVWGALNFTHSYLNFEVNFPRLNRPFKYAAHSPLLLFGMLLVSKPLFISFITFYMALLVVTGPVFGLIAWRKKVDGAFIFFVSWSFMIIGLTVFNLAVQGVLSSRFVWVHSAEIGVAIESVLLSFALIFRMRHLEKSTAIEIKQSHDEVSRALVMVKKSNAAKDAFMTAVGHQLKTPIHLLMGNLQLLEEEFSENDAYGTLIEQSDQSATELLFKIENLLTYSQIVAGDVRTLRQKVNVRTEFMRMEHKWKHLYEKPNIHVELSFDPKIPMRLELDWVHVRKIIRIALENSVDATARGQVFVNLSLNHDGKSEWLECSIRDYGKGITSELETWFNQGTLEDRWDGNSMALFMSKCLIQHIGGQASLLNAEGGGAVFTLKCPVKSLSDLAQYQRKDLTGLKVLIVDDIELNLKLMKSMLKKLGAEAVLATNGEQAIEVLSEETIGLVLMDCQMPGLTGQEATIKIRENHAFRADLPIIAVSANDSDLDRESCLYAGMNDFIAKPVRLQSLDQKLKEWLV
jgi:CheY-like chemotaxis protein